MAVKRRVESCERRGEEDGSSSSPSPSSSSSSSTSPPSPSSSSSSTTTTTPTPPRIPHRSLADHASPQSCWLIIRSRVYDVTSFLPHHPGGAGVILECAGRGGGGLDATAAFEAVHSLDLLRAYTYVGDEDGNDGGDDGDDDGEGMCRLLGVVDWWREGLDGGGQREGEAKREEREVREERKQQQLQQLQRQRNEQVLSDDKLWRKPALEECLNLDDFENVARRVMSEAAWAYYSSGADDEVVSISPKLYLYLPFTLNCTPLFFFFSCRSMDKSA